ncbi:NAD(P)/FAD-dependent oxidoreductase [Mycobacterium sp. 663a-19]|uniref:NAD(P)/FAD-dependent oxidoreductase n=1 Tax=Mycobacterium sp. 663a-19 TaxID=2986148 RepID=UPI002D1F6F4E|nr:NAD(P)/FAD-dependent oxidoreductase [Mycobacterium sp. 663a-19]MEB3980083.1 NAD(P)/FAD-dependent oxidoreductase [Mycobacterium sp. 663a-19]
MNNPGPPPVDTDVLIIGAGPSGLFASYYAGLRGLSVALLDSLAQPGGQLMALYPDKPIYDVAGLPEVMGSALVASLTTQAELSRPAWLLGEQSVEMFAVEHDSSEPEGRRRRFRVVTDNGRQISASGIIIAAGIGSFQNRKLNCADDYLERGVHYTLRNVPCYVDVDVVIVGGGDSAVDWANMLCPVARSVTLIHRRRNLTAHPMSVKQLQQSSARVILDSEVVAAHGDQWLEAITVRAGSSSETIKTQALIPALGHIANLGPLLKWGLKIESRQIVVDSTMATNIRGVFAVGDVTTYPGKVRIMAVGFGEAATAVNNLAAQLDPGQPIFPGHSTELMRPAAAREG